MSTINAVKWAESCFFSYSMSFGFNGVEVHMECKAENKHGGAGGSERRRGEEGEWWETLNCHE